MDAEIWYNNFFTSPPELCIVWSMGRLQVVIWQHHLGHIFKKKPTPPHTSLINNKYPGMFCLHTSILSTQVWRNKRDITPDICNYLFASNDDWLSYDCTLIKWYSTIIKEHYYLSCSIWRREETNNHPYLRNEEIMHDDTAAKEVEIGKLWNLQ